MLPISLMPRLKNVFMSIVVIAPPNVAITIHRPPMAIFSSQSAENRLPFIWIQSVVWKPGPRAATISAAICRTAYMSSTRTSTRLAWPGWANRRWAAGRDT